MMMIFYIIIAILSSFQAIRHSPPVLRSSTSFWCRLWGKFSVGGWNEL